MSYEVEMKFPVADPAALERRLVERGGAVSEPQTEVDVYFGHPVHDFAQTDEALRLRRKGSTYFITYKGPKIDATTKTRREIDLPLTADLRDFQTWFRLLEALGFKEVGEVRKSRRKAHLAWQGRSVEISLDTVEGLGAFVELELVVEEAAAGESSSPSIAAARAVVASLAEALGLAESERRSYLELLRDKL
jgi:adenylate cyclase, class 2